MERSSIPHGVRTILASRAMYALVACLAWGRGEAAQTEVFPKKDPAKEFAEMKIYDVRGLPWRAASEDWDGAIERVASDPAWQAWLKKERAAVTEWIKERKDRVEWVAGWFHDFVSPKDGSLVIFTPDVPGEQSDHFRSATDSRIEPTAKLIGGWVHKFRTRHAVFMERAARLYRLTGDQEMAEWAAAQLDFYAANLKKWPARQDGARVYCQTLSEATGLVRYAEVVRLLGKYPAAERREKWYEDFFVPEVEIIGRTYRTIHNIACWQRSAAAQVALVFGDVRMWGEALEGECGVRAQLEKGVTSDYLWYEQSLSYNQNVVEAFYGLFEMAGLYGRAGELSREMAIVENLLVAPAYLRFPDGMLPNPSDSYKRLRAPDAEAYAACYRVYPTPLGLRTAAKRRDWETLLSPPVRPPRPNDEPVVTSQKLISSRMAVLRRGPWQVFFHFGQLAESHAQQEALNFSAYYENTDVTHDAGVVPYGSPLYEGYFTRGAAQNCLLINGEGQEKAQPGELLEFDPHLGRMTALQAKYQPGALAKRSLSIEGSRLVDTATVQVGGSVPQVLGMTLHLQGNVEEPRTFMADPKFSRQRPTAFGYWRNVKGANFRDRAEFKVRFGERVMRVTIACPGEFRLWLGNTPDTPPPNTRNSIYVETLATQTTFTTIFQPIEP